MVGDGRAQERAAVTAELSYDPTCIGPVTYDPGAKCGEKMDALLAAVSCWAAAAAAAAC